jgi:hypothetical protein
MKASQIPPDFFQEDRVESDHCSDCARTDCNTRFRSDNFQHLPCPHFKEDFGLKEAYKKIFQRNEE